VLSSKKSFCVVPRFSLFRFSALLRFRSFDFTVSVLPSLRFSSIETLRLKTKKPKVLVFNYYLKKILF